VLCALTGEEMGRMGPLPELDSGGVLTDAASGSKTRDGATGPSPS
jgi:hypothetical protein